MPTMNTTHYAPAFRVLSLFALIAALFSFTACSENPVAEEEHEDSLEDLAVTLTLSTDHVHTLTPVDFTVEVHDHHGTAFTAFETIQVDRRLAGSDTWRTIELSREGNAFKGSYTFNSSGEYELRVSGMLHGHTEMAVMHQMPEVLHVGRAHVVAGSYRVEFENFPGHVHQGETAEVKFWVKQAEEDASGNRPAVAGLAAQIQCEDASGFEETHVAEEREPGVYQAEHTFAEAGEAHMAIHFTGTDGSPIEADFHLSVAHGH